MNTVGKPLIERQIAEHMGEFLHGSPSKRVGDIDGELRPPSFAIASVSDSDWR